MKISITHRLFLAILAATSLAVVSMFFIMQWSFERGFLRYVNMLDQARFEKLAVNLEMFYAEHGSWEPLKGDPARWLRLMSSLPEGEAPRVPRETRRRFEKRMEESLLSADGLFHPERERSLPGGGRIFDMRIVFLDGAGKPVCAPLGYHDGMEMRALRYQGHIVGRLGLQQAKFISDAHQLRFVKEQKLALAMVGGVVLLLAAGLSLPLANRLVRPIRGLATATDRLAAGEFGTRVPVLSSDELGQLARDFNALALTLEKNETARRQWVADISHELRTPLAILRGEIEALQDGVRQPNRETINSLHGEVLRLGRLVDDLYQLSTSDLGALSYRMKELHLTKELEYALEIYHPEFSAKSIVISEDFPRKAPVKLFADRERLQQLFGNLLNNSLKYTDDGGTLHVSLKCEKGEALIDFQDSGPGVPESEMGKLFDRFYRVEVSRNRATGGAGLGLAICRNIAEAHAGTISARKSGLGGLWIRITLPLEK